MGKMQARHPQRVNGPRRRLGADAVLLATPDGTIIRANRVACTLFGVPMQRIIGRRLLTLAAGDDHALSGLLQHCRRRGSATGEVRWAGKKRTPVAAAVSGAIFFDRAGRRCISLVIRHIARRDAREKTRRCKQNG